MAIVPRHPEVMARDIEACFRAMGKPVYFGAVPYLQALKLMNNWTEPYFNDRPSYVAAYLLGNLTTMRGPEAKAIRAELKAVAESMA
jgi:hypothetical protein